MEARITEIKKRVGDDPKELYQECEKLVIEDKLDEAIFILKELEQKFRKAIPPPIENSGRLV